MNIKITIDESSDKSVKATLYTGSGAPDANVGTLWMTRNELDDFLSVLTFGMPDGSELVVDDPTLHDNYIGD